MYKQQLKKKSLCIRERARGIFRKMHRRYWSEETEGKNDGIAI